MITNKDDVIFINDIKNEIEALRETRDSVLYAYLDRKIDDSQLAFLDITDGLQLKVLELLLSDLELIGRADERCIIRDDVVARELLTDHMLEVDFDGVLYLV